MTPPTLTTLLLKLPRGGEVTPEAAKTFLAALSSINKVPTLQKLIFTKAKPFALEIAFVNQQIQFLITCDSSLTNTISTQIQSNYPLVVIEKATDPAQNKQFYITTLALARGSYYPLATFDKFTDVDPLSSVLNVLSKGDVNQTVIIQYALEAVGIGWQGQGAAFAASGTKKEDGSFSPREDQNVIKEKILYPGFKTSIRIATTTIDIQKELASAFGVFTRSDGNSLVVHNPAIFFQNALINNFYFRGASDSQIINIAELATLWHLPSEKIKTAGVAWGINVLSEPPENLPVATDLSEEAKADINFFGKTVFKNQETIFGIKNADRFRHIWAIGKTGTGKSTLIQNMAIDDFKKGRGMALIDPHGDSCETLLDYIPKERINDVIYFNPADRDFPISINPLEVTNREDAELVVSGLMSIFTKIWENVWSARMEYILRNSFMTLAEIPNSTLSDVLRILSDQSFRNKIVSQIKSESLKLFWQGEFDAMPERLQKEAIAPIQNKVGQFITSPLIQKIINNPKSTISIDEIMGQGKILLANLSQGKLGEDNATLLGATLITKFQLAAMHRVDVPENQRRDFYLYVDEFQNFATRSFIKILSEARKYRLSLMLANQYIMQIPEDVRNAILGNAGTIATFTAGAQDAAILNKEFAEVFAENDLVNLAKYQIAIKLMIDGHSTRPFMAHTLPLPKSVNQNREKVIRSSRERWAKKVKDSS